MRILNTITSIDSTCFQDQVRALESRGVTCENLSLSQSRAQSDGSYDRRSVLDYARFFPRVVRHSFADYDVLHANYGLTAPPAVVQPSLPVVVSLWGSDLMGRYGPVSKACARFADEVVVMSDEMAAALDRDCHVIPHGVDTNWFEPMDQARAQSEVGWDSDAKHVLFPYVVSRPVKNFPLAEQVVEDAAPRVDAPVELQTVSGIDHEEMATYMNAADALLLTSRREGSPNTVKEALACNLPVVSTDVGDVSRQLRGVTPSATCQNRAELTDELVSVLEAGTRSNGRRKVLEELSLERMGERLVGVYESAIDG